MVERSEAIQLFERRRDAWLAEDVEGYLACFADDIVMEIPGREPVVGIGPYRELVMQSLAAVRPTIDGEGRIRTWREYYDASLLTPTTPER